MKNNFIDENIFKIDDINLLNGSEELINTPCVVIQNIDYTPLQASIIHSSNKIRNFILKQNNIDINVQNSKGENALITAILHKAPLNFIKELFRRNVDVCLPKDSKYSNILDFADPKWEGYSELKHMVERRKSYNFSYRKQNSEKQIENKYNIKKKEKQPSNSINLKKFGSELTESHKKNNEVTDNILNLSTLNSMNFDRTNLNLATNHFQTMEGNHSPESNNRTVSKKNVSRNISKSISIPKSVLKPSLQYSNKDIKKDIGQINNMQDINYRNHESETSFEVLETEDKLKEYKGNVDPLQNMAQNEEEQGVNDPNDETKNDISLELIHERNKEHEVFEKKTVENENYDDKRDENYKKYIGVDDEYMLLIGYQLNESIETSKKLFTCTCCALNRPWKSATE
ncbi:uncharacterized protein cubi_01085 [Cryptosporidium ubiquitum]|uniref:Ankyrin repeat-containing protein n=1 Tax=Cryptosporidium ubiquitum TaxID=857276 RepID=A0A1J4MJ31_9CRYT|nr:uncharacterized protein cubi_01085 [Cryptosporidium ubiquitum]OII74241.1 hypothetical protein cubi_01085 [Cryptosporidium ubiquitum]